MPLYEYKCPECESRQTVLQRGDRLEQPCVACGNPGPLKRVFSLTFPQVMQEHFNHAVGKPISDMRQFERELRKKGDIATETTGIEHRYAPVDMSDKVALGVTNQGIDESNRVREKMGEPLLPDLS